MQRVPSNFDTDLFTPLIRRAVEVVGRDYDRGPAGAPYRVLADHARATAFLLADGVYPASDGRGYVLRRILRRAVRYAWQLGRTEPTLVHLALAVVDQMRDVYPELDVKRAHIERIVRAEEERFLETIDGGLRRLEELRGAAVISGDDAFKLYDTYGFPLDLTQMIARERGQEVDAAGFERALGQQRQLSRAARAADPAGAAGPAVITRERGAWVELEARGAQRWVGYDTTRAETRLLAFRQADDVVELVLAENPFYVESGGQVDDTGLVRGSGWEVTVEDVERADGRSVVAGHFPVAFAPDRSPVLAQVNEGRRRNIERNHTATHLVHAALRKILGTHVRQAGSVVAPDRLRFDFSHHGEVPDDVLAAIEEEVNAHVWENLPVTTRELPYAEAITAGAMAFFTEKYGDVVRVVDVPGVSLELCGGTHVRATGEIGLLRFTHEVGAAAGVRRIEAITGPAAYRLGREVERRLDAAAAVLKARPEHLARRIESLVDENRKLERRVEELITRGGGAGDEGQVEQIGDVALHVLDTDLDDRAQIGLLLDQFRAAHRRAVAVLFAGGSRPGIHVAVTDDLVGEGVKAPVIANALAAVTGGKGGGRPHFASAGAGDAAPLADARERAPRIVRELLAR
jgi:alanyl-tRNA synthetase